MRVLIEKEVDGKIVRKTINAIDYREGASKSGWKLVSGNLDQDRRRNPMTGGNQTALDVEVGARMEDAAKDAREQVLTDAAKADQEADGDAESKQNKQVELAIKELADAGIKVRKGTSDETIFKKLEKLRAAQAETDTEEDVEG